VFTHADKSNSNLFRVCSKFNTNKVRCIKIDFMGFITLQDLGS
jgi:hypothetical protein